MSGNPVLLLAAHPTRGVDVGAQAAIWDHIREARQAGLGVLLISADLDELIGLSDTHHGAAARPARRHLRPAVGHPPGARDRDDGRRTGAGDRVMSVLRKILTALTAPLVAVVAAVIITSLVVMMVGSSPGDFWSVILSRPPDRAWVNITNQTSMLYLSAIAAAIGFKMNLFNIGVEGQYRIASVTAAAFAGMAWLPGPDQHRGRPADRDAGRGGLGGDRGDPAGDPRRQRGHLDHHAQRHRGEPGGVLPQHLRAEVRQRTAHRPAAAVQRARRLAPALPRRPRAASGRSTSSRCWSASRSGSC